MEIAAITSLLGSLKTATDIAKFIRESDLSLEKAEAKLKLAELVSAIADAKIEASEIQQALQERDEEIRSLKNELKVQANLQWEPPYYWLQEGESKDGPYCQHCYDTGRKLIRLYGGQSGYWECKACKSGYEDKTYTPHYASVARHDPFEGY